MKIKLLKQITYQDKNGNEDTTDYIYIKKPTLGDLMQRNNIGLLSNFLNKVQKYLIFGYKETTKVYENINEEVEKNEEKTEQAIEDDTNALENGSSIINICTLGGYDDVIKDLIEKCPCYFDKFLFVDEKMEKDISSALIKQQLTDNGDILDLYKIMLSFFFQAMKSSSVRKIEL